MGSVATSTHPDEHAVIAPGHTHAPPAHVAPKGQKLSHAPQLFGSVRRSTQPLKHNACGGSQRVHAPEMHICPAVQSTPHAPQLKLSDWVFVQKPLQLVSPPKHGVEPHEPALHVCPDEQMLSHEPQ